MEENNDELRELEEAFDEFDREEEQNFEDYFKGLYESLCNRYDIEYSSTRGYDEKVMFLSGFLDEIIAAKRDAKYYNISPVVAKSNKKKLDGLFNKFESEIQDLPIERINSPATKKKAGRPTAIIKSSTEYLDNIDFEEKKPLFIEKLKDEFESSRPRIFVCVIRALKELGYIKTATNKEIKESFQKALNCISHSQSYYDKEIKNDLPEFYDKTKSKICKIRDENCIR